MVSQPDFFSRESVRETVSGHDLQRHLSELSAQKIHVETMTRGADNGLWILQYLAPKQKVLARQPEGTGFRYDPQVGF